ncbi:MAG: tryptophan--tRNA ligase [Spirochaetes bacterium GWD1_27_9]|nr:MAG: tryptophan--tRNA ligase [Spirochaetes bacterium GWC1_27_15]OHD28624.1 MAG: tryptophan--tRNA ligase [Spirochaetes bacterium GWD1_27_9]
MNKKLRVLSGIQPSGILHIGNYFGAMKQFVELQEENESFIFIADFHALTSVRDPNELRKNTLEVAINYLAVGLDPKKVFLFKQSDVPEVCELSWYLSTITPMGLLERCHSYKDKIAKGIAADHGLFAYPVLMAADILIYKSDIVPVGKDQKQHVEVARDIAIKFNNIYNKEVLKVPDIRIKDETSVVPGIDGQKMSKSYNNYISPFWDEKEIKKTIMRVVTDSTPVESPKDPDKCNVFALYKLMASKEDIEIMRNKYLNGGYGYGDAKKELLAKTLDYFAPIRKRYVELKNDIGFVEKILKEGAEKARSEAINTIEEVRKTVGIK